MMRVTQEPTARPWLTYLASGRTTLVGLGLLAIGVVLGYQTELSYETTLPASLGLLSFNLLAAMWVTPSFRRQPYLVGFHLALLLLVGLLGWAQLSRFTGAFELVEGETFYGPVQVVEQGYLHKGNTTLPFRLHSEALTLNYGPGYRRDEATNRVSWQDAEGTRWEGVIGDHVPLIIDSYRIYTSRFRGFSVLFRWLPANGGMQLGRVNLPSYLENRLAQAQRWTLPGQTGELWAKVEWDSESIPTDRAFVFEVPPDLRLILRDGEVRHSLEPGDIATVAGGRLQFLGADLWMGYQFSYDPAIPWLIATSVVGVIFLMLHYFFRFQGKPWNR